MENSDKLALHAIIIKKIIPIEEAKEIAQEFIKDKKKHFYRETVKSYRFRNIPKTHFIPKFYKTKKINKNVSIIIGKLKPEHEHLEGSGLFDFIKKTGSNIKSAITNTINKVGNIFKPRLDSYNNTSRKTIEQYGNLPINSIMICRTPIMKVLDKALNFLSLGKFSELKQKYGFDELYHLQLVANVGDKNIVLEKNEVININTSFKNDSKTQIQHIKINPPPLTINEILEKGREKVGNHLWFSYDAFKNNCQFFIKYCLEGVNLYDESAKNFLFQDIEELAKEMPQYVKTTANVLTTTGAITNKLMGKAKLKGGIIDGGIRKRYTPVIDARHHIGTTPDDEFKNLLKSYTIKRLLEIIQFNNFSNYAHLNKPQLINVIHNHFLLKDGQIMRKMESSFHTDETKTAYREGYIDERDERVKPQKPEKPEKPEKLTIKLKSNAKIIKLINDILAEKQYKQIDIEKLKAKMDKKKIIGPNVEPEKELKSNDEINNLVKDILSRIEKLKDDHKLTRMSIDSNINMSEAKKKYLKEQDREKTIEKLYPLRRKLEEIKPNDKVYKVKNHNAVFKPNRNIGFW